MIRYPHTKNKESLTTRIIYPSTTLSIVAQTLTNGMYLALPHMVHPKIPKCGIHLIQNSPKYCVPLILLSIVCH